MKYMKNSFKNMKPYHSKLITDGIILNANESPYNPPKEIIDEFHKRLDSVEFNRYPDMDEEQLNKAIAKHYGIDYKNVTVGVGSDELLDACFRATIEKGDKVLGFSPSFSMYKVFTELEQGEYIPVVGDENYLFDVDKMIELIKIHNPKLVLVCSPNNPTGQYFTEAEVRKIIESTDSWVLLDLAYIDFSRYDYAKIALEYDNVISFKTFSKALSLPSIRCGYAISNIDNIDMINAIKAPYSVTTISQILAEIAISKFDLYKMQIDLIKSERERLYQELKSLDFNVFKSEANFILVKSEKKYFDILEQNKIYIRRFDDTTYRITVGSKSENDKLIEVLKCAKQK